MARRITSESDLWDNLDLGKRAARLAGRAEIEEMLEAVNLMEVLERDFGMTLWQLPSGEYRGHCPFPDHRDGTPSFDVANDQGVFLCRGCQRAGTLLQFLMLLEGLTYGQAIERLSEITGIGICFERDEANEMRRAARNMERAIDAFFAEEAEATRVLPGGMTPEEFLVMLAARMRAFEGDMLADPAQVAWADTVYAEADALDERHDWRGLTRLWKTVCDGTRKRRRARMPVPKCAENGEGQGDHG